MRQFYLTHRSGKQSFDIPSEWNVLTFADIPDRGKADAVEELTEKALRNPIKSPPLEEVLSNHDRVAIIIEDITRSSPKKRILEILLQTLERINIPDHNISIIIALGTHRKLTPSELEIIFGKELLNRYEFNNHDCHAPDLKPVGRLRTGREAGDPVGRLRRERREGARPHQQEPNRGPHGHGHPAFRHRIPGRRARGEGQPASEDRARDPGGGPSVRRRP